MCRPKQTRKSYLHHYSHTTRAPLAHYSLESVAQWRMYPTRAAQLTRCVAPRVWGTGSQRSP
eukprot:1194957-Prorocentrum_minimum.AAC.1